MECPRCHHTDRPGTKFCTACGSPLPASCPLCGAANPPAARFCGDCGAKLAGPAASTLQPPSPSAPPSNTATLSAERRQLTVMFCDLVGSTGLSARLDPEDMRDLMAAYHKGVADAVARFDGFTAQYLGDGVLVYFGYPLAHEDEAERAVRAGLAAIAAVDGLEARAGVQLQARVGIATGLVVVGEQKGAGDTQERVATGETPNLAARLQAIASPGEVVIAASTRRLVGRMFDCRSLGIVEVKGLSQPVEAWQVRGELAGISRFEALHTGALSPFVGRQEEIDLLLRRWHQAKAGEGRVVLLAGEPGIGKSRIAENLVVRLEGEPHVRLRYFCTPHHAHSALYPFIAQLERAAGFEPGSAAGARLEKLVTLLMPAARNVPQELALIAELLAVPVDGRYPAMAISPQQKREMTLTALLHQLEGVAAQRPVLIVFEDAHWIDPTSLDLLDRTVARVTDLPVLLVITFRPEFQPAWVGQPHVTMLPLSRLDRRDGAGIIAGVTKGKALPESVAEQILARTDGVPLFIEELTSALLESGILRETADRYALDGPLPPLAIPTTLQASLVARLDRLATVKDVAQIGAAIGREFSYELISAVASLTPVHLDAALERLTTSGLLSRRGTPPAATYSFKHALVQDAAYATLLKSRRQQLHASIAKLLIKRFPAMAEGLPEVVAHHLTEAGLASEAIGYWLKAGQLANDRSASKEAVSHLTNGLDLLHELPYDSDRDRIELTLQSTIGPALVATKGYAAPEAVAAYERARELMRATNEFSPQGGVLAGLFSSYYGLAKYDKCFGIGRELLETAERQREAVSLCIANRMIAVCNNLQGNFPTACDYAERAWSYYDPERDGALAWRYAHDIGVSAKTHLAMAVWHLGQLERSASLSSEVFAMAQRSHHLNTIGYSLWYAGSVLSFFARDFSALRAFSDQLQAFGRKHRLPNWAVRGELLEPPALAATGELKKAIAQVDAGVPLQEQTKNTSLKPLVLAGIAEVCLRVGRGDQAVRVIGDALAAAEASGELWMNAELWRLRADAHLAADGRKNLEEARACYQRAMTIAEGQGSRMFCLRAATSLAKLMADQGQHEEARDLLEPIYGRFTEGFLTPDLKDAKALLGELRQ
jgi:class 3 adenylate cyclase/predicted ATPase